MTARQWLWRLASRAPLAAWGLSLALPIAAGGWELLRGPGTVSMQTVQQQIESSTTAVIALREQLDQVQGSGADNIFSDQDPEQVLKLLLQHDCGLRQEIELSQTDEGNLLVLHGDSLEALCALRVVRQFSGGVQRLRRVADGTVNLTWEGTG